MPKPYAQVLAQLEEEISRGSEAYLNDEFFTITGHEPKRFRDTIFPGTPRDGKWGIGGHGDPMSITITC